MNSPRRLLSYLRPQFKLFTSGGKTWRAFARFLSRSDKRRTAPVKNTQSRLLSYLRPHYKILSIGLICAALTSGIDAGIAWFIKSVINSMMDGHVGHLNFMCGAIVLVYIIKGLFSYGQNYSLSLAANRVVTRMRDQIFEHLHSLSLSFFNRRRTGAIMSVLTNDVPVIQNAAMNLRQMISAPLTIVISMIILFNISWELTLLAIIFIPFMALAISKISRRIRHISTMVQDKLSDVTNIIEETVAGARVVKSFAAEVHEIARFREENERTLKTVMHGVHRSAQLRPVIEFIGAFGIALVLFVGGNIVANTIHTQQLIIASYMHLHPGMIVPDSIRNYVGAGGMTAGALIAFLYLLDNVARAAGNVGGLVTLRAQALSAAARIFDQVLDEEPEVKERANPIELPLIQGRIQFQNVCFQYGPDTPYVLKDISFEMTPGEIVAIVGRSGSGKSTLSDLIPRFYDPTEGDVIVDGFNLRDVQLMSLRKQIGIVPQETWLFAGSLRDNISYGNRSATDEQIWAAASDANASFLEGMPEGLETIVGDRGIRLSGGERQRIAIARAILMNPRILILDEATSSLDASSEALVQEALERLMKGRTTLVIAHRLSTIINADRILAMQDGRIIEMGSHHELMETGGYYARLYETQLRGFE